MTMGDRHQFNKEPARRPGMMAHFLGAR